PRPTRRVSCPPHTKQLPDGLVPSSMVRMVTPPASVLTRSSTASSPLHCTPSNPPRSRSWPITSTRVPCPHVFACSNPSAPSSIRVAEDRHDHHLHGCDLRWNEQA